MPGTYATLQPFTSGEVVCFIGVLSRISTAVASVSAFRPIILGTGKVAPEDEMTPGWAGLMNDGSGSVNPYDKIFEGQKARTSIELNRVDMEALGIVQSGFPVRGRVPGQWAGFEVGTILNLEGMGYPVWFLSKRRAVAAMAVPGMPAGIRYYGTSLISSIRRPGTKDNSWHISWEHTAFHERSTDTYRLFDYDMSAVNGLAPG